MRSEKGKNPAVPVHRRVVLVVPRAHQIHLPVAPVARLVHQMTIKRRNESESTEVRNGEETKSLKIKRGSTRNKCNVFKLFKSLFTLSRHTSISFISNLITKLILFSAFNSCDLFREKFRDSSINYLI